PVGPARGRAGIRHRRQPKLLGSDLAAALAAAGPGAPRPRPLCGAAPGRWLRSNPFGEAGLVLLLPELIALLPQLLHHRGITQRRHVAQLAALSDVAEQPAH